jgi:hypothetical protein
MLGQTIKKPMKNDDHAEFTEQDALDFFVRHLDELKWNYRQSKEHPILYSGFNGKDVLWDFNMIARAKGDGLFHLSVNSFIPNKALPGRRVAAAELISRINWELALGCFEMNHADGEIRFRTSVAVAGADITQGIVEHLLHANLCIVDERLPQIMSVLYSDVTPAKIMQPKAKKTEPSPEPRFKLN